MDAGISASRRADGLAAGILEIARAEGEPERVGDELYRIARAFEASEPLRDALTDPRIPVERKQGVIAELLGGRASDVSIAAISMVVGIGRSRDLPEVVDRLASRIAAERDRVVAEVRTAIDLDEATVARLAERLSAATGKQVETKVVVDPAVIGGVVATVGDMVFDGSVRRRLNDLRETWG